MDALATIATVARGCGHKELTGSVLECALRLVNGSWQHIQKVRQQVFESLHG